MKRCQLFGPVRLAFAAALLVCASLAAAAARPDKPNILFVLIDDMGWKDIGCAGSTYLNRV